jgi:hypothetical protein
LRWGYTAITRASKKLYVINPPYITPFSAINFSSISNLGNIPNEAIQYNNIPQTPYHSPDSHPAKKLKYHEVLKKVRDTPFTIDRLETKDYHEMYYFSHGENDIRINAHHNSAGIFRKFTTQSELESANQLLNCVNSPKNQKFTINYIPSTEFLSKLYSKMRMYCDEFDIEITNVVEKTENYYVIYYLCLDEHQFASIQFYFNNNGQFSRANPKAQNGPSTNKLKSLIQQFL